VFPGAIPAQVLLAAARLSPGFIYIVFLNVLAKRCIVRLKKQVFYFIAIAGLITLLMASCGPGPATDNGDTVSDNEAVVEDEVVAAEENEQIEGEAAAEPTAADAVEEEQPAETDAEAEAGDFDMFGGLAEDEFITTDSGLRYAISEEGEGPTPEIGELVAVHYTGWLEDGTQFDSSVDRGEPITFPLGQGRVIAGWDEGIALLDVGDKGRLIIPSTLAYGPTGSGPIPPDSTLIFDVELVEIRPGPPEAPAEVDAEDYTTNDAGVQIADLEDGSGDGVTEGQLLSVDFNIWLSDGTLLDSTLLRGQPVQFVLGQGQFVPGWDESFEGMKVGGLRQMVYPAAAFNAGGAALPEDSTVIFEVQLLNAE